MRAKVSKADRVSITSSAVIELLVAAGGRNTKREAVLQFFWERMQGGGSFAVSNHVRARELCVVSPRWHCIGTPPEMANGCGDPKRQSQHTCPLPS